VRGLLTQYIQLSVAGEIPEKSLQVQAHWKTSAGNMRLVACLKSGKPMTTGRKTCLLSKRHSDQQPPDL